MLEFSSVDSKNAIHILKTDHQSLKDLFDRFERAGDRKEKKQIVTEALKELKVHAAIEEEIFYRTLRKAHEEKDIMNEADEEHHVARLLVAELSNMSGSEDHYDAKFKVLAESVRHHIREEESNMMPKARALDIDFEALGEQLLSRKQELMENGVPQSNEDRLIADAGIQDSPARAALSTHGRSKGSTKHSTKAALPKRKGLATGTEKRGKALKASTRNSTRTNEKVLPMRPRGKRVAKRAVERA